MKEYEATSASDIPRKKEERKIIHGVPRFIIRVELRCACATKKHASFDTIYSYDFLQPRLLVILLISYYQIEAIFIKDSDH